MSSDPSMIMGYKSGVQLSRKVRCISIIRSQSLGESYLVLHLVGDL